MPLPSSGPISLNDLRAEFGGSGPIKLSDYYRGGGLAPNSPKNTKIPTSGAITLPGDFHGAQALTNVGVNWANISGVDLAINANKSLVDNAILSYSRSGNGAVTMRRNNSNVSGSSVACSAGDLIHFAVSSSSSAVSGTISVFSDQTLIDQINYSVGSSNGVSG